MPVPLWYPRGGNRRPAVSANGWDVLVFDGEALAGRARITQASAAWKVDDKRALGKDADPSTKYGFDSTRQVAFEIETINIDEFNAVNRALAPYVPRPGGSMLPVSIDHPSLAHMIGFFAVTIRDVSEWRVDGAKRVLRVTCAIFVGAEKAAKRGGKTVETPKKALENLRTKDAQDRGLLGGGNPEPSKQPGYAAPEFASVPR